MQTYSIPLDELNVGDLVFAENEDAETGAIHGRVLKMGRDVSGTWCTWIEPVSHEGRRVSVKVRTGLFGAILRIES